ncbi:MAG TPA: Tex family protein [Flavitalea sp.]|nr:Tex family protein [Flavitalea sp.]
MEDHYIRHIASESSFSVKQVTNVSQLIAEGATIPFIARYRKEATGNLDEVQIGTISEKLLYYSDLRKRKETVLKTIDGLGKLTAELRDRIEKLYDATTLEDLYLPFKPKRKTKAVAAIEKGLEPLAHALLKQDNEDPVIQAKNFITDQVKDVKEALQGARDIIAEQVAENEKAREAIRKLFSEKAILSSRVMSSKKEVAEAQKYRDYFTFNESLSKCPSHRVLAIRRGEKDGYLSMDISIDEETALHALNILFVRNRTEAAAHVADAIRDGYARLLKPSIENEFRISSKNSADEDAIQVFSGNLQQLLLAAPLGSKRILAIDPGFRTGCKVVCLDEHGNFIHYSTIFPHPPQQEQTKAISELKSLVIKFNIEAIGIGNGTAGRETEHMVRSIDFGMKMPVFMVNESGASIYSASEVAREEFPQEDITVRGAISIGRRLLDPLSELVKIDAKSIGVGQYQHDVNQVKLKEELDKVVVSCVNRVGVDVNTASRHLLSYVSGLNTTLAKNIVNHRAQQGSFKSREELKKVSQMGPKTFEQAAGFLRIRSGINPLDNSSVHPESYYVVEKIAADLKSNISELLQNSVWKEKLDIKKYVSEKVGEYTLADILKELEKPGRDPREQLEEVRFDENVRTIEDLKAGMILTGIVTNITNFGVFVDLGVKQDGLIHISQLSNQYVSDPNNVVKLQQQVRVTVTEVDVSRKRIGLTMKEGNSGSATTKKPLQGPSSKTVQPATDPFQQKLAELKKKFKE